MDKTILKDIFFLTFLAVYAATAVVALLGLVQKIKIKDFYLRILVSCLIVDTAGSVIALWRATNFWNDINRKQIISQLHTDQTWLQQCKDGCISNIIRDSTYNPVDNNLRVSIYENATLRLSPAIALTIQDLNNIENSLGGANSMW
jgi:hypothetical protein